MYVFGEIKRSSTAVENNLVNYTHNLSTSSANIQPVKVVSGSSSTHLSSSYWSAINVLFYTSGSPIYSTEANKFAKQSSNFSIDGIVGKQHLNKFHGYPSCSVINIPQRYYGEKIKEGSFSLTEKNYSDLAGVNPVIKDDGLGNLYSTNAHHSQSTNSPSSSDNYVGNIFYEHGIAVVTETGSWSGSGTHAVNYSDLATNYDLTFDSSNTITTYEYNVNLSPQEYNLSTNYSLRSPLSTDSKTLNLSTKFLKSPFTGSEFQPYITTINLYQQGNHDEPVIQATLPRPIRKSDKVNMRFKIRLDI